MAMRARLLFGAAMALLPLAGASAETIQEALAKAYASNPTLAAEQANLRSVDESLPQALAQRRPSLSGQGQGGYESSSSNIFGYQNLYPRSVSISLDQPLWTGGRADAAVSQADYSIKAERANLLNIEQQVLLQAATAYLDVVQNQAVLNLAVSNVKVLKATLDQSRAQLNAGLATKTDLAQAEARLAQGLADQRQAQANLTNARATYRQAVGDMPGTLVAPPPARDLPINRDNALQLAASDNPQVLTAQAQNEAAQAGVDVAQSQLMPSVALSGQIGTFLDERFENDHTNSAAFLITLTVPLYQAGTEYSRVRQAKQSYGRSRSQIDVALRQATQTATDAWENLQAAQAQVRSFTTQIEANQIAYNGVVEEQRVGTRTLLDVLNAEQELFGSQVNLVEAQRNAAVSAYQVKSAIGQMTAAALGLDVPLYDPRRHYDAVRNKWIGTGVE
jgi:outer membrane protein